MRKVRQETEERGEDMQQSATVWFQTTAAAEDSATVDMVHAESGQLSGSHRKTF